MGAGGVAEAWTRELEADRDRDLNIGAGGSAAGRGAWTLGPGALA